MRSRARSIAVLLDAHEGSSLQVARSQDHYCNQISHAVAKALFAPALERKAIILHADIILVLNVVMILNIKVW